jgi:transcriptional regulator with XRE-family HTH domain
MRMPRRRWTDFPAGLRRVRVSSGLTQSDLAEMLNVDQATISRWERGAQMPDAAMQNRLSDARLGHLVRSAVGLMALINAEGKFLAVSDTLRKLLPPGRESLRDIMTPSIEEFWNASIASGFFRGEVASVHTAVEFSGQGGGQAYLAISFHPVTLADGAVLMLAEGREVDATAYQALRAHGLRVAPLEDIL